MAATKQPATPAIAVWALRIGGGVAGFCGALLSFVALYRLGLENGWPPYAAWALPVAVDALVATAFVVAMAVPRGHAGATVAHLSAGVAMLMTTGCNVLYHALLPATTWSAGHVALVATGAAPALVMELIIVMQMYLGDGAQLVAQEVAPATRRPAPVAVRDARPGPSVPVPVAPPPVATVTQLRPARDTAPAAETPRTAADDQRDQVILRLLAAHGRADKARGIKGVTGPMVGDALGIHRANGARALANVLERVDAGTLEIPADAEDPDRELVSA